MVTVGSGGTITGWTDGAEGLLGYRATEVVGRSLGLLFGPDFVTRCLEHWSGRARLRKAWAGTAEVRHRDGPGIQVFFQAFPRDGDEPDWVVTAAATPCGEEVPARRRTSLTAALLARAPVAVSICDGDGRYIWGNEEAERRRRIREVLQTDKELTEFWSGSECGSTAALVRRVFETGEPVVEHEQRWSLPGSDEEFTLSSTYFRLDDAQGSPLGVCRMTTDVSGADSRTHLLVLNEAGKSIGTTLDVIQTAQELADFAVPRLADYVTIDLAESVPLGGEPLQRLPASMERVPVFRRAGAASIHPEMPESLWDIGDVVYALPSSPFTRAVHSGQTHYEPVIDTSPGTWLDRDPERLNTIRKTGMHSLIIVPLRARGTLLGEAVFVRTDNPRPFSRNELLLCEEIAARASLSLDNARRFTRERAAALTLQQNLLPQNVRGGKALEVASRYLPADTHEGVGGDWFDVIALPGNRTALVVGDVVGHGINAAARMGQFRTIVRTLAELDLPPDELLTKLDHLVARLAEQDNPENAGHPFPSQALGGTCVYAVYDPASRICTLARAGHPPPAVLHPDGTVTFPDLPAGTPIGVGLGSYESVEMELSEDSILALYTDGLIESRESDLDEGLSRLASALQNSGIPLEDLCEHVTKTMSSKPRQSPDAAYRDVRTPPPLDDDIALLLARPRGPSVEGSRPHPSRANSATAEPTYP
ncbi:SpoIIE family protein phosphatase [Streptomyces liangshanensis]|uniref:SpoIIE family protein phosphatase n=1 Tax=Streptomyces liangshanensis TaxID=2717324 RepID=UPI0024450E5D|nr:SpoIIE family protein phosphatase [Streptomyces liangshanensis]